MRNIVAVINKMLKEIPVTEAGFRGELESIKTSAMYAAPETMGVMWRRAAESINYNMPYPPATDWQKKVGAIFADKE